MPLTTKITNILKPNASRGFFNVADVGNKTVHRRSMVTKLSSQLVMRVKTDNE
jgi:hypothetical protein